MKLGFSTNINETTVNENKNNDSHCALSEKKKCLNILLQRMCHTHSNRAGRGKWKCSGPLYSKQQSFHQCFPCLSPKQSCYKSLSILCRTISTIWFPNCTLTVSVLYAMYWLLLNPDNTHNIYHTQLLLHSNYILGRIKKSRKQGNT